MISVRVQVGPETGSHQHPGNPVCEVERFGVKRIEILSICVTIFIFIMSVETSTTLLITLLATLCEVGSRTSNVLESCTIGHYYYDIKRNSKILKENPQSTKIRSIELLSNF